MATKCENCPLRRHRLFAEMSADEVRFMQHFKMGEMVVDPGTTILMQGANSAQLFTVLSGLGLRYRFLEDGRRQVVNLIFPGDFIGLQAAMMGEMGHSVTATTAMTLCVFNRSAIWDFFKENPERAFAMTWLAAIEEHFLGDTIATLGQRNATESVAWALSRIYQRAVALDLLRDGQVPLPYRQQDLADALGLSLVHTNKTLARLKNRQLAYWADGMLSIPDPGALAALALMEPDGAPQRPLI